MGKTTINTAVKRKDGGKKTKSHSTYTEKRKPTSPRLK